MCVLIIIIIVHGLHCIHIHIFYNTCITHEEIFLLGVWIQLEGGDHEIFFPYLLSTDTDLLRVAISWFLFIRLVLPPAAQPLQSSLVNYIYRHNNIYTAFEKFRGAHPFPITEHLYSPLLDVHIFSRDLIIRIS